MKKTFTLGIECLDSIKDSIQDNFADDISTAFRIGLIEYFGGWQGQNCSLKLVEQNCGTPESIDKNALDLLKRASDSLNDYCAHANGDMNDSLASEIDNYIEDNKDNREKN